MTYGDKNKIKSEERTDSQSRLSGVERLSPSKIAVITSNFGDFGAGAMELIIARGLHECGHHVELAAYHLSQSSINDPQTGIKLVELDCLKKNCAKYLCKYSIREDKLRNHGFLPLFGVIRDIVDYIRVTIATGWRIYLVPTIGLMQDAQSLRDYLNKEKPDFVISNDKRAIRATQIVWGIMKSPPKSIIVIHGESGIGNRQRFAARFQCLSRGIGKIAAVSKSSRDWIVETVGISHEKVEVIYNGVDAEAVALKSQQKPDHSWYRDSDVPIVLAVGRLSPEKDFFTLLHAFCQLRKKQECRLMILGDGPMKNDLIFRVTELEIQKDVEFTGFSNNPYSHMHRASVFALSSIREGFSRVLLEALACGCPCVSTDCGGPREILEDGRYGTLVPVGDHMAMADALDRTIRKPPQKEWLRRRAGEFSIERMSIGYEQALATLAAKTNKG